LTGVAKPCSSSRVGISTANQNLVRSERMAELATKKMTVAKFVRWEDGTDTRYGLLRDVKPAFLR
jgi:hypothetical protein